MELVWHLALLCLPVVCQVRCERGIKNGQKPALAGHSRLQASEGTAQAPEELQRPSSKQGSEVTAYGLGLLPSMNFSSSNALRQRLESFTKAWIHTAEVTLRTHGWLRIGCLRIGCLRIGWLQIVVSVFFLLGILLAWRCSVSSLICRGRCPGSNQAEEGDHQVRQCDHVSVAWEDTRLFAKRLAFSLQLHSEPWSS